MFALKKILINLSFYLRILTDKVIPTVIQSEWLPMQPQLLIHGDQVSAMAGSDDLIKLKESLRDSSNPKSVSIIHRSIHFLSSQFVKRQKVYTAFQCNGIILK